MVYRYGAEDIVTAGGRTTLKPAAKKRANKMHAVRTSVDGVTFASGAEAKRFLVLKTREKLGVIRDLELQPRFVLAPAVMLDGKRKPAARYTADFRYVDVATGESITEDVKGMRSEAYVLRRHLVRHLFGIEVKEVK